MSNPQADKRSVSTDALETLGMIIGPNEKRDAIHLAVEPIIAAVELRPGQDVGIIDGKAWPCNNPVGIVDPFLKASVMPGERFWLVVYPRQITSLRHVWSHPAFVDEVDLLEATKKVEFKKELDGTNISKRWIEVFATDCGLSVDELMDAANAWVDSQLDGDSWGEYLNRGGLLEGVSVPDEFWTHFIKVTGRPVAVKHRGNFFTCAC